MHRSLRQINRLWLVFAITCLASLLSACGNEEGLATPTPGAVTIEDFVCFSTGMFDSSAGEQSEMRINGVLHNDGPSIRVDSVDVALMDQADAVVASESLEIAIDLRDGSRGFDLSFSDLPNGQITSCRVQFLTDGTEVASAVTDIPTRPGF